MPQPDERGVAGRGGSRGAAGGGFAWRLWDASERKSSWICLGLDIDLQRLPANLPRNIAGARRFLHAVVDACAGEVVAFKPNLAFYLSLGAEGWDLLADIVNYVSDRAIVIVDGKFGDVANTSERYASSMFDAIGCDAVTLNPYGGRDSIRPLIDRPDRGAFVWTRSSNPGADEFQGLELIAGEPVYIAVARQVSSWDELGNLGLVVGATYPSELAAARQVAPRLPILVPGVGAQGGDLEAAVSAGLSAAPAGVLVNAGRSALWASDGGDYATATLAVLRGMRERVQGVLAASNANE